MAPQKVKLHETQLHEPFDFSLFGKLVDGFSVTKDSLAPRIRDSISEPRLAYIYGYSTEGALQRLPRPAIFVVNGDGSDPSDRYKNTYPNEEYRMWRTYPTDETVRLDVLIGPLNELVDTDVSPGASIEAPEGATVIRGADGRVYCIPASLDSFEVMEEDQKSALDLSAGTEMGTLRVKSLSARAALTSRAAMTTRAALTARAAMVGRAALTSRAALTGRAAMTGRAALTSRAALASRAALVASIHETRDDD